jgi:NAD(P)H dehydrogenase (quinone)
MQCHVSPTHKEIIMIIVTGATGQLGRAIVEKLVERVSPNQVGVSVRDPEKAADLTALGVRVRHGDFNDPESLRHAFEGATQVLIVSSNAGASGGDPLAQHRSAIEVARDVGVRRIVYTSHMAASDHSAFPPMLDHHATEEMLRQSGLAWTALRHGFYAESGVMLMGDALKTGVIEAPADGKVSWTAHADLAEAAAIILADEGRYDGPTPPLTGSHSLNFADLAAIASELLGSPVIRQTFMDEELRAKMAARGAPDRAANMALGLYIASRKGEFALVDPTLERLLGRPPVSMREVLAARFSQPN